MMRFDELLHETIEEMAGEVRGPSAAFVSSAKARGRRIRLRRHLTAAGGAVLACLAVVVPVTIVSQPSGTPVAGATATVGVTIGPSSQGGSAVLAGGWVVTGTGSMVLDRTSGEYVSVGSGATVLPAPVGDRVLVGSPSNALEVIGVRGALPAAVDTEGLGGVYRWSPKGDRLVTRVIRKEPFANGFAIIDAETGVVTKHWIDASRYDCSQCEFSWTRDGREVVLAIADRSRGESAEGVKQLQLFDPDTGEPTRSLPVSAAPTGPFSWSPTGRYVIAAADILARDWRLFDLSTGSSRPFPYNAVWATDDHLLATDGTKVLTLDRDGTVIATAEVDIPGGGDELNLGPSA